MSTDNREGHHAWGPWVFDFRVTDYEGLALKNVSFGGKKMIHKISLPVIRVKYVTDATAWTEFTQNGKGCGPYNDIIRWDPYTVGDWFEDLLPWTDDHHLSRISNCSNKYVCLKEIDNGQTLEIGVYALIGKYHLYQCYYITRDGRILPRLWSKGLSCNLDHRHHPYWRIDADVDGSAPNRINQITGTNSSAFYTSEGSVIRNNNMRWNFENLNTHSKLWIEPGGTDEGVDNFSKFDAYVRKFRPNEDKAWWRKAEEEIAFNVHEPIADADDKLLWYIAHLSHQASEGADHWHPVGPTLRVDLPPNAFGPETNRNIRAFGSMVTVDDEWGSDEHDTDTFDATRVITPIQGTGEFFFVQRMGGEIRVELKITAVWFTSHAAVTVDAKLFEGTSENTSDLDASRIVNVNVNHGGSNVVAFQLLNSEWNSPDRSNIHITITNTQA